ncbi:MAG TPA: SusC/RagA family TonB-linked outer membrane protein [Gemmatimonadaceae bacterium]|nr:SusC/RagA family TonB-linked outer membrane protein [Gemmatimonadaceae bacterium]
MAVIRRLVVALVGVAISAAQLAAQGSTGTITGRVVDSTSQQPLAGVAVSVVGTELGAITRDDGAFAIASVPTGSQRVRARRIGYGSVEQPVTVTAGAPVTVQFSLPVLAASLGEVVVTGYGTQRRAAITGSVETVDADQANVGVVPNVNNLIQGRAAGVNITVNSGEPGAGAQVRIRGGTSISASNEPLYVIDGVPIQNAQTEGGGVSVSNNAADSPSLPRSPLTLLNPADIANITILKDAAATAIYGSRAANGVVLIETKKGAAGPSVIEYDGYVATSAPERTLDVLNGSQYRAFVEQLVADDELDESRLDQLGPANTDWEDEVTRRATTQNHNLSFAGGTPTTQYRASLNYMNQEGIVLSNGFRRYQGRLNAASRLFDDRLQLGLNLTASQVTNKYLAFENQGGFEGGVFANMVTYNPTRPVMVEDPVTGTQRFFEIAGQQSIRNPVALAEQINDKANTTRTLGNLTADYEIVPNLRASVNVGVDRSTGLRQTYFPAANPLGALTNGRARQTNRNISTATLQTLLTYNQLVAGEQSIEVVAGYEYSDTDITEFGTEARDFLTDAFGFNNLGAGATLVNPYSIEEPRRLSSVFARANYGYRDRYFLTGVVRRDGSSVFGANNKYAVFPAVSASWRISEESFMDGSPFSELRLRAGYGLQGNQAILPFQSLILLGTDAGARYELGNGIVTGVTPSQNANPDLKWETTAQTNVAVDFGLYDERLSGTLEYYVKDTRDLLLSVDVPQPAPVGTQIQNIGRVRNRGFEASLDGQILTDERRSWAAGLVVSFEHNEVVDLGGRNFIVTGIVSGQGQSGQRAQRIIPGEPLGTFYGPQFVGVNDEGQQLFNKYTVTRDESGRETSREVAGTTTTPGADDNVILGDANPDVRIGLHSNATWGAFDASLLVRAEYGAKVFNNTALVNATKGNVLQDKNFLASALNDGIGLHEPAIFSSRYIEDASFIRLQNVTVGYTLNPQRFGVSRVNLARIYVSGDNLLLSTDYSGYDPEVYTNAGLATRGIDYLTYPRARTFTVGVRLGF